VLDCFFVSEAVSYTVNQDILLLSQRSVWIFSSWCRLLETSSDQRCLLRALEITTKIKKEEVRKEIKLLGAKFRDTKL